MATPSFAIVLLGVLLAASMAGTADVQLRLEPLGVASWLTAVLAFFGQVAAEELIFRVILPLGLALSFTSMRQSFFWGVVLANLAFAWWHLPTSLPAFIDHFAFGLLLALLYARTRSLVLIVIVHLTNNFFVLLVDAPLMGTAEVVTLLVVMKYTILFFGAKLLFTSGRLRQTLEPPDLPKATSERQPSIDILRGLALMAIVLENSLFYSVPEWTTSIPTGEDLVARAVLALLVEYRGLPIFCVLLGFTAHLTLTRYGTSGPQLRSRAKFFIVLGAIHGLFVFPGDILAIFGIALLVILWFKDRSETTRRLFVWVMGASFVLQAAVAGWGSTQTTNFTEISAGIPVFPEALLARALEWSTYILTVPFHLSAVLFPILLGFTTWKRITTTSLTPRQISTVVVGLLLISVLFCFPNAILLGSDWGQSRSGWFVFLGQLGGLIGALGAWIAAVRIRGDASLHKPSFVASLLRILDLLGRRTLSLYLGSSLIYFVVLSPSGLNLLAHMPLWSSWASVVLILLVYGFFMSRRLSPAGWAEQAQLEFCRPRASTTTAAEWKQTSGDSRGDWIGLRSLT